MILKSVKKLEDINGSEMLKLTFEDREAYMLGSFNETSLFIGEDVAVEFDDGLYKGNIVTFVYSFGRIAHVKELSAVESPKLYTDFTDNSCTVCFSDIDDNAIIPNATVYCLAQNIRSSIRAVWGELSVRDMKGKVASVRIFNISEFEYDFTNSYVKLTLSKSPTYGFSSESVSVAPGFAKANPEVMIAYDYINKSILDNTTLRKVLEETSLLDRLKEYNHIEVGYELMSIASELEILKAVSNITPNIDYAILQSAIIMSRAFVTSLERTYYSKRDRTTFFIAALKADSNWKKKLIGTINGTDEDIQPLDNTIFKSIKEMSEVALKVRRGV